MSETEIAYIAGLVDGEACISVNKRKPRRNSPRLNFQPRVSIGMTCELVLRWIEQRCGGRFSVENRKKKKDTYKQMFRLDWHSVSAINLLRRLLPFLIVKKEEAELLIRLGELKAVNRHCGTRPITNWEDQLAIVERLALAKKSSSLEPFAMPDVKPLKKEIRHGTKSAWY